MAIPFIAPLIPLLKVLALGSIKFVFIVIGSIIAPILTFRALAYGTTPTNIKKVKFLAENGLLDEGAAKTTVETLEEVLHIARGDGRRLSRAQARLFLKRAQSGLLHSMKGALINLTRRIISLPQRLSRWHPKESSQQWNLWRKWTWGRGFIRWRRDTSLWLKWRILRLLVKVRLLWSRLNIWSQEV